MLLDTQTLSRAERKARAIAFGNRVDEMIHATYRKMRSNIADTAAYFRLAPHEIAYIVAPKRRKRAP